MAAYVVYQGDVIDPQRYEEYKTRAGPSIAEAGGRFLVRGGDVEVLEGDPPPSRTVIVEFPTTQAALDWYRSDAYTEARKIRERAARAQMYVVEGIA